MLVNIVLTFASRDTFNALGDTTSRERRLLQLASELGNATTIQLSIQFPQGPADEQPRDWWHNVSVDFGLFQAWYSQIRQTTPLVILDVDAWWTFASLYSGWPTLELMCNWVIDEDGQGHECRLKMVEGGEIQLLLQGIPFGSESTRNERQALAKLFQVQDALS